MFCKEHRKHLAVLDLQIQVHYLNNLSDKCVVFKDMGM